MPVKYHCPKCERRFVDWGAEKLGFKCPACPNEELVRVGANEGQTLTAPKLTRRPAKPAKTSIDDEMSLVDPGAFDEDLADSLPLGDTADFESDADDSEEEEEEITLGEPAIAAADVVVADDDDLKVAVDDDDEEEVDEETLSDGLILDDDDAAVDLPGDDLDNER